MKTSDLTHKLVRGRTVTCMYFGRPQTFTIDRLTTCRQRPHLFFKIGRGRESNLNFPPDIRIERGADDTLTIRDIELGTVIIGPAHKN